MSRPIIISDPSQLQPGMLVREYGWEKFGTTTCYLIGERDEAHKAWKSTRISNGSVGLLPDGLFRIEGAPWALVVLAMPPNACTCPQPIRCPRRFPRCQALHLPMPPAHASECYSERLSKESADQLARGIADAKAGRVRPVPLDYLK